MTAMASHQPPAAAAEKGAACRKTRRPECWSPLSARHHVRITAMATSTSSRIGRPSKGDRKVMYSRVPAEIAALVEAEAQEQALPYSDVIANALAAHFGRPPVAVPRHPDQLQMTA